MENKIRKMKLQSQRWTGVKSPTFHKADLASIAGTLSFSPVPPQVIPDHTEPKVSSEHKPL